MDADRILFIVAVVSFTLTAAVVDVRSRKIPNWLTVPAFLAGVVFHTIHSGWHGLGLSLGGFVTGFALLLVLMAIGGGGGGDVKLMGALGAWLGCKAFLAVFVLGSVFVVIASVLSIVIQVLSRRPSTEPVTNSAHGDVALPAQPISRMQVTYALPVALATWAVLAWIMISHRNGLFDQRGVTESKPNQSGTSNAKSNANSSAFWESALKSRVAFDHSKAW
jgi:prepilin peptidase CpaA